MLSESCDPTIGINGILYSKDSVNIPILGLPIIADEPFISSMSKGLVFTLRFKSFNFDFMPSSDWSIKMLPLYDLRFFLQC